MQTPLIEIFILVMSFHKTMSLDNSVVCRDNSNRVVDWFFVYKQSGSNFDGKSDYLMLAHNKTWSYFPGGFTSMGLAPALKNTLGQLLGKKKDTAFAMYSDQPPTSAQASASYGHAKGVLAKSGSKGFFLVHSLPKFPLFTKTKIANSWSQNNAQLFQCISLNAKKEWDKLVKYVTSLHPFIYHKTKNWVGIPTESINSYYVSDLNSLAGHKFRLLSKSKWGVRQDKDIFEDVIAPHFRVKLAVTSWQNGGGGKMETTCSSDGLVDDVAITEYKSKFESISWPTSKDHSKWAVSRKGSNFNLFCIADMNRMTSQKKRYGGAVCMEKNGVVVKAFRELIKESNCGRTHGE